MSGILALVTYLGGWGAAIQLLIGVPALIGSVVAAWKQFQANKTTKNALAGANVTAATVMAALNMVPATPAITEAKKVITQLQAAVGSQLAKQDSLLTATKQVLASAGLGDPLANEATAHNVAVVADAIAQSEKIRANRAGVAVSENLPELPKVVTQ